MLNPTVVDLDGFDSVVITRNGKVVGFVEIKRERNNAVELLANPVTCYNWTTDRETHVFNSFATTLATNVESPDEIASASNFINFMNGVKA